ncbi:MAG: hypothetical protein ACLUDU_04935 [Butyricimonas faecihominis]
MDNLALFCFAGCESLKILIAIIPVMAVTLLGSMHECDGYSGMGKITCKLG